MPSELQRPPSSSTSHWATTTGRGWTMQVAAHTASTCILSSTTEEEFKLEFGLGNFEWINGPILTFLFIARCWQCFLLFFFFSFRSYLQEKGDVFSWLFNILCCRYDSDGHLTNATFPTGEVSSFHSDVEKLTRVELDTSNRESVITATNFSATSTIYTLKQGN